METQVRFSSPYGRSQSPSSRRRTPERWRASRSPSYSRSPSPVYRDRCRLHSRSRTRSPSRIRWRSRSISLSPSPRYSRFSQSRSRSRSPGYCRSFSRRRDYRDTYRGKSSRYSPVQCYSRSRSWSYDSSRSPPTSRDRYRVSSRSSSRSRSRSHREYYRRRHLECHSRERSRRSPASSSSRSRSPVWHQEGPAAGREKLHGKKNLGELVSKFVDDMVSEQQGDSQGDNSQLAEIEEMLMRKFGIPVSFDSSKGKHVPDADVSAVKLPSKRQPRQYMNRKCGFNKPLPSERNR